MDRRPQLVNVRASQISSKVQSKKDLYDLFKDHSNSNHSNSKCNFIFPVICIVQFDFSKKFGMETRL